jgi:hypothetical protein
MSSTLTKNNDENVIHILFKLLLDEEAKLALADSALKLALSKKEKKMKRVHRLKAAYDVLEDGVQE